MSASDSHGMAAQFRNSPVISVAVLQGFLTDHVMKGLLTVRSGFIYFFPIIIYMLSLTWSLSTGIGWRALVHPKTHPVSEYEFEVIIGGDGRRNTLEGNAVFVIHLQIELILKFVRTKMALNMPIDVWKDT